MARLNINEIRRKQIVDAAITVMARRGWSEASIDEITREADVSRGLVSYHFKDKKELLSGVLTRCKEVFDAAVSDAIEGSRDPVERMRIVIRASLNQISTDPVNYEVFLHFTAGARAEPELGEQIRDLWAEYRTASARAIRVGQRRKAFRQNMDPDAAAAVVIGSVTGVALQWLLAPNSFPLAQAGTQIEEMLISYLTEGVDQDLLASLPEPPLALELPTGNGANGERPSVVATTIPGRAKVPSSPV
jgi:AcrR family transcriptional regulator